MVESCAPGTPGGVYPLAGRSVARIGYGLGQLTRRVAAGGDRPSAIALLRRAFDLGVRHFDTAQFYSDGLANELLRDALGAVRDDVVVATKAGARPVRDSAIPLTAAQRPPELRAAVEANLATLQTDRLDVVNLRRMDFLPGLLAEGDQVVKLEDQLAELRDLRTEGKILDIGLSHITLDQLTAALPVGIGCVQNIYHLLDRTSEDLLRMCEQNGVAWVPYFPLGGGGDYAGLPRVVDDDEVKRVADQIKATPSQVGLAWQLGHAPNTMLIPGTGSVEHLVENIKAGDLVLDPVAMQSLESRS